MWLCGRQILTSHCAHNFSYTFPKYTATIRQSSCLRLWWNTVLNFLSEYHNIHEWTYATKLVEKLRFEVMKPQIERPSWTRSKVEDRSANFWIWVSKYGLQESLEGFKKLRLPSQLKWHYQVAERNKPRRSMRKTSKKIKVKNISKSRSKLLKSRSKLLLAHRWVHGAHTFLVKPGFHLVAAVATDHWDRTGIYFCDRKDSFATSEDKLRHKFSNGNTKKTLCNNKRHGYDTCDNDDQR